jgi:hypothetical protein
MPRSALLTAATAAILTFAVPEARALTRMPAAPAISAAHTGSGIQPAIVMFDLAIVRMRMLNTLTELVGSCRRVPEARRW